VSGGAAMVTLSGELDVCAVPAVEDALRAVLDQGPERLILDLAGVTFIDCAATRTLAAASRALPGSRKAVIRRPGRAVRRILELTGMSRCFWIQYSRPGCDFARTPRAHAQPGMVSSRVG
jgi:anti-anti-sigma factor